MKRLKVFVNNCKIRRCPFSKDILTEIVKVLAEKIIDLVEKFVKILKEKIVEILIEK